MEINGKTLMVSILLGAFIALFFRAGMLAVTTDFSYVSIFGFESVDLNGFEKDEKIGWDYWGKAILNPPYSGFPFPAYSDCSISALGFVSFAPRCEEKALGEWATVLNFLLWTGGIYFLGKKYGHRH